MSCAWQGRRGESGRAAAQGLPGRPGPKGEPGNMGPVGEKGERLTFGCGTPFCTG